MPKRDMPKSNEKKENYVLGLKKNQKTAYKEIKLFINYPENQKLIETYESLIEKEYRRIKKDMQKIKEISWFTDD